MLLLKNSFEVNKFLVILLAFYPIGIKVMTRVKREFACGLKTGIAYDQMIHLDFGVLRKNPKFDNKIVENNPKFS